MGVITFVTESPTRNDAWVNPGWKSSNMNIGMNTGARMAHLAEALPINKFRNADRMMKQMMSGRPVNPMFFKNSAPLMARIKPKLL